MFHLMSVSQTPFFNKEVNLDLINYEQYIFFIHYQKYTLFVDLLRK